MVDIKSERIGLFRYFIQIQSPTYMRYKRFRSEIHRVTDKKEFARNKRQLNTEKKY